MYSLAFHVCCHKNLFRYSKKKAIIHFDMEISYVLHAEIDIHSTKEFEAKKVWMENMQISLRNCFLGLQIGKKVSFLGSN